MARKIAGGKKSIEDSTIGDRKRQLGLLTRQHATKSQRPLTAKGSERNRRREKNTLMEKQKTASE